MSKDPAILFYTSDFLRGIEYMTMEERGQYITLLCNQHQSGHIPLGHMLNICKSSESLVFSKFTKDEKGLYYNERLDIEINKRKSYCASRANNKKGINQHTKQVELSGHMTKHIAEHMTGHMVNVNEDVNKDINEDVIRNVIEDLNLICRTNYKHNTPKTKKLIKTRLKEGFKAEDFYKVHKNMFDCWYNNEKMRAYLRPITLYGDKFESYLNQITTGALDSFSDTGKQNIKTISNWLSKQEENNVE